MSILEYWMSCDRFLILMLVSFSGAGFRRRLADGGSGFGVAVPVATGGSSLPSKAIGTGVPSNERIFASSFVQVSYLLDQLQARIGVA